MSITKKNLNLRPSISTSDKNWYSEDEIATIKKAEFEKGKEHFNKEQLEKYSNNLFKAQQAAEEHFDSVLKELNIKLRQIRLKPNSINSFELIFLMPEGDYFSPNSYKNVFENGTKIIQKHTSNNFCISFTYMPFTKNLNNAAFLLDGFLFTYDPFRRRKKAK